MGETKFRARKATRKALQTRATIALLRVLTGAAQLGRLRRRTRSLVRLVPHLIDDVLLFPHGLPPCLPVVIGKFVKQRT
jgi:hypothetical protein